MEYAARNSPFLAGGACVIMRKNEGVFFVDDKIREALRAQFDRLSGMAQKTEDAQESVSITNAMLGIANALSSNAPRSAPQSVPVV